MIDRLTNRQVRALCYSAMMVLIVIEPMTIGAGLFLAMMDTIEGTGRLRLP